MIFINTFQAMKRSSASTILFLFFIILLAGALCFWIDISVIVAVPLSLRNRFTGRPRTSTEFSLNCSNQSTTTSCVGANESSAMACPGFFRWIHEDLRPWKDTGISRDMLERAKKHAHFRLVIVEGKAYVEHYSKPYQTRDVFTIWGILQLLNLYPGKIPDLELMFRCGDKTVIQKHDIQGSDGMSPPVLFQYCGHSTALNIVFPDWTFWGWAETNIKPWKIVLEGMVEGNKKIKWQDREPYAYWRGNPHVSPNREDLMKCNVSDKYDWLARLYEQNWGKERERGYKDSKLEEQCTHRYKIYIEGNSWSVSEKYILACDSMALLIKPEYYDFFSRSMEPMQHYWPIRASNKCKDIKFAVEWGNNHSVDAQAIGKAGSKLIQENLKMQYVYEYMFHLFKEYAKLLRFKPKIPAGAIEVSSESTASSLGGLWKMFILESVVKSPDDALVPCTAPPPYDAHTLQDLFQRKENVRRQVEMWGDEYWENLNKKQ
ncbi:PREDICTED: O-glucosyltransferase rumi homolog [Populus euphratica]|uniref:O-glucosyltransferase rumi homolog n=1 Tax=Populus euphratica TaxID=75702 RepID=A0AAJ6XLI4_POPEU|nr:PREDICTED: O-glucosyltransferase rumi homolog [Populus euphratica]